VDTPRDHPLPVNTGSVYRAYVRETSTPPTLLMRYSTLRLFTGRRLGVGTPVPPPPSVRKLNEHVARVGVRADVTVEVCNRELMNLTCSSGRVILVNAALYGRMRVGRCVQRSLGYVDCQADVLQHIEVLCSGRQQCAHRMPDDTIYDTQPCPPDVTSYLEITYRCLTGKAWCILSYHKSFLWPPCVTIDVIFLPCGLFFFFIPRLISAVADWMSAVLAHMVWP